MSHSEELKNGRRFAFGANWSRFLKSLNEARIRAAEDSLCAMLDITDLKGKTVLDVGSGSGLFSLAAIRLGAQVHSFDYDPQSVSCTVELQHRYFSDNKNWVVEEGSILEQDYLYRLGKFDLVYSWGVLHHTGQMWRALENITPLVRNDGILFIAIYNDQGWVSKYWTLVKRIYNSGKMGKISMTVLHAPYLFGLRYVIRALTGRLLVERGMSLWYDMIDWLGGYPFEVATPEAIFKYFRQRGFVLENLKTCKGRMGCNEFVFRKL